MQVRGGPCAARLTPSHATLLEKDAHTLHVAHTLWGPGPRQACVPFRCPATRHVSAPSAQLLRLPPSCSPAAPHRPSPPPPPARSPSYCHAPPRPPAARPHACRATLPPLPALHARQPWYWAASTALAASWGSQPCSSVPLLPPCHPPLLPPSLAPPITGSPAGQRHAQRALPRAHGGLRLLRGRGGAAAAALRLRLRGAAQRAQQEASGGRGWRGKGRCAQQLSGRRAGPGVAGEGGRRRCGREARGLMW